MSEVKWQESSKKESLGWMSHDADTLHRMKTKNRNWKLANKSSLMPKARILSVRGTERSRYEGIVWQSWNVTDVNQWILTYWESGFF